MALEREWVVMGVSCLLATMNRMKNFKPSARYSVDCQSCLLNDAMLTNVKKLINRSAAIILPLAATLSSSHRHDLFLPRVRATNGPNQGLPFIGTSLWNRLPLCSSILSAPLS